VNGRSLAVACVLAMMLSVILIGLVSTGPARAQTEAVLVIAQQSDPGILNNIVGDTLGSFIVHHMVWSELLNLGYDGQSILPDLAKSWDVSSDGLNYTFHLRTGVKWHDGTPFTADDVKFTFDTAIALPTWAIAYLETINRITVNDPYNVTFTLKARDAAFLTLLAFGSNFGLNILPKHLYEGTNISTNSHNFSPIGTGPFKFSSHITGQSLTLVANADYWGGRPPMDRIVIKIIPNSATAALELQAGTVQYLVTFDNPIAFSDLGPIARSPGVTVSNPTGGVITWLLFNTNDPVIGNATLRQAIGYAVNRSELAEKAYFNYAKAMDGFYLEGSWLNTNARLPYDPTKATQLLDQLGYTPGVGGVRLTVEFAFHPLFGMDVEAQVLKEQLAKVGIALTFWSGDYPTWFDKVHTRGQYQIALRASQIGPDPSLMWHWLDPNHVGESGSTFFNDTAMTNLFLQARESTDQAARRTMYNQVQQILHDNVPVLPLTNIEDVNLWRSDMVKNVGPEVGTLRWDVSEAEPVTSGAPAASSLPLYAGVAVAVIAIAAVGAFIWRRRRTRARQSQDEREQEEMQGPPET
jgi:peptide/nickel transport system substrate-binding protein